MKIVFQIFIFLVTAVCLCPISAYAVSIIISTNGTTTLGGNTYYQGELIRIDDPANPTTTNSLYATVFGNNRNLDAAHVQNDGKIMASHDGVGYTFGTVTIFSGDVVRYDPVSGVKELYLKGSTGATTPAADIWGNTTSIFRNSSGNPISVNLTNLDLLPNGHILLSGADTTTYLDYAGGGLLSFQDEDVVEYDPVAKKAVGVYFDGTPYYTIQTNAFARLRSNEVLVSLLTTTTIGGTSYTPQQIVKIDTNTGTASLFMTIPGSQKIDAIDVVPEPATLSLLGLGITMLLKRRRA